MEKRRSSSESELRGGVTAHRTWVGGGRALQNTARPFKCLISVTHAANRPPNTQKQCKQWPSYDSPQWERKRLVNIYKTNPVHFRDRPGVQYHFKRRHWRKKKLEQNKKEKVSKRAKTPNMYVRHTHTHFTKTPTQCVLAWCVCAGGGKQTTPI